MPFLENVLHTKCFVVAVIYLATQPSSSSCYTCGAQSKTKKISLLLQNTHAEIMGIIAEKIIQSNCDSVLGE